MPFYEVDTHNIVPCWITSPKQEYGAYTIRPKVKHLLPYFLEDFPKIKKHPFSFNKIDHSINFSKIQKTLKISDSPEIQWIKPGERSAQKALKKFIRSKLTTYDDNRNNPVMNGQSDLSPYLHFGHLSAQRVALAVNQAVQPQEIKESFLEELIVRRELSDNFCFYNSGYDTFDAFPEWAKKTLKDTKEINGLTSTAWNNLNRQKPMIHSGMLPSWRWYHVGKCMDICVCTGRKKY